MTVCIVCNRDRTDYYFSIRIKNEICRDCTAPKIKIAPRKRPAHKKKKKILSPLLTAVPDIDPKQFYQVFH